MTKTEKWNGHEEDVVDAMQELLDLPEEEQYEKLFDMIQEDFNKFYATLEDEHPLKVFVDFHKREVSIEELMKNELSPELYAVSLEDIETMDGKVIKKNTRVRVTTLTPVNDLGISIQLNMAGGYIARVSATSLKDYSHV